MKWPPGDWREMGLVNGDPQHRLFWAPSSNVKDRPARWVVALCQTCDPLVPIPFNDGPDPDAARCTWIEQHARGNKFVKGHPVLVIDHDDRGDLLAAPSMIRHGIRSSTTTPGGGWSMLCGAAVCQAWRTEFDTCAAALAVWRDHDCPWVPRVKDED